MRRILKLVVLVLVLLVVGVGLFLYLAMRGLSPIPDGRRVQGVEVVRDGYVSAYIVDLTPGEVALVDAGNDMDATAIIQALGRRGLSPSAVKAVLLTHGDLDHVRGIPRFPGSEVMGLSEDVELVEGRRVRGPRRAHPTGARVGRTLSDGEVLALAGVRIEVFALPGHTPGSAAYLVHGVLLLGDSAEVSSKGQLQSGNWLFTANPTQNRAALRGLAARLRPRASEVKAIACSHSGVLEAGLAPLVDLAERLPRKDQR